MFVVGLFNTPAGTLEIAHDEQYIYRAIFIDNAPSTPVLTSLCQKISDELSAYTDNPFHRFQLPLKPSGTLYQHKVWQGLLAIPSGRVLTYGELARHLDSGPRAIGQACRANPIPLFIPCHRVVAQNGLGGYMGEPSSINYKRALLQHEQVDCTSQA